MSNIKKGVSRLVLQGHEGKYHIEMCSNGDENWWVAIGPGTGAPWFQVGFATEEDAKSACELLETVRVEIIKATQQAISEAFENEPQGEWRLT